jgi:hypothetical protein
LNRWHKQSDKNANDGNHHQQFNERESAATHGESPWRGPKGKAPSLLPSTTRVGAVIQSLATRGNLRGQNTKKPAHL